MKKLLPFRMSPSSWGKSGRELELAQAEYELSGSDKQDKIVEINNKFDKEEATEKKEPWVNVIKMGIDPENVVQGYFELDWNTHFVTNLKEHGFSGNSDEEIVDHWFSVLCNTIATEDTPMGRSPDEIVKRTVREDGKTEIS